MAEQLENGGDSTNGVRRVTGPNILSREEFHAKERAAFLAGEDADEGDAEEQKKPAKSRQGDDEDLESDDDEDDEIASGVDGGDDEDDDLDDDDDDDEDEVSLDEDDEEDDDDEDLDDDDLDIAPKKDKAKADPDLEKRRAQLRKNEQRSRKAIADERAAAKAEIDRERAALKTELDELANFRQLKSRRHDPVALYRALGIGEEDFEHHARVLYSHRKGAEPKDREAAAKSSRERETVDEIAELKKWRAEREKADADREAAAAQQREVATLLNRLERVTGKLEAPLMQRTLKKNPAKAHEMYAQAYLALQAKTGTEPSPKSVVARCEKMRRRELKDLGVDVSSIAAAKKAAGDVTKGKKPGAKPTTETVENEKPLTGAALKADILKNLADGNLS